MIDVDKIKIGQKVYKVEDCFSKTDYKGVSRNPKDYKINVIERVVVAIITTKKGKSYICKDDRTTPFSDIINGITPDYIYEYDDFLAAMLKAKELAFERFVDGEFGSADFEKYLSGNYIETPDKNQFLNDKKAARKRLRMINVHLARLSDSDESFTNNEFFADLDAIEIAGEALGKRIPQKPKLHKFDDGTFTTSFPCTCACGAELKSKQKYCSECGQAIDWSDEK